MFKPEDRGRVAPEAAVEYGTAFINAAAAALGLCPDKETDSGSK
jgi:hypothetical protein